MITTKECPNCGGEIKLTEGQSSIICKFCNTSIVFNKETFENKSHEHTNKIKSWKELAKSAHIGGNSDEAIEYYNKILEVNDNDIESWIGKAGCIWTKSTLSEPKLSESASYLAKAIEKSNYDKSIINDASSILSTQIITLAEHSDQYWNEHQVLEVPLQSGSLISKVCLFAVSNGFDKIIISKAAVYSWNLTKQFWLDKEGELIIPFLINILDQEPSYKIELIDGSKKVFKKFLNDKYKEFKDNCTQIKPCFVATATMGNYDHPYVIILQNFRDTYLIHKNWGNQFINLYYTYGPTLANIIENNFLLKKISFFLVIMPMVTFLKFKRKIWL